jgi:HEAT repeat protein
VPLCEATADQMRQRSNGRLLHQIQGSEKARAIEPILRFLDDSTVDDVVRSEAARALGRLGDHSASPALLRATDDLSWRVRFAAVRALIEIRERTAGPKLVAALHDDCRGVRLAAARGLGVLRSAEAAPELRAALTSDDMWLRLRAAEALAAIGEPDLKDLLQETLARERWRPIGTRRKHWARLLTQLDERAGQVG